MVDGRKLVPELIRGDEAAWRTFVEQYGRLVYSAASRAGLTQEEKEDVFQSACAVAAQTIGRLRDPTKLSSWIYGIARRLAVEHVRKRPPIATRNDPDAAPDRRAAVSEGPSIQERLERLEEVACLYDALESLESRCRMLLFAIYIEHPRPSYKEIARREKMPIGSIGPTKARCLEKVRQLLSVVSSEPP